MNSMKNFKMSLFVTVGSTSFDKLIETVCSEKCIETLVSNGFQQIKLQIGRGNFIPPKSSKIEIEWFRFKDNLSDNIKNATLVVGHAGAGTILESLFECKPLIVVLNEELMENHQSELADKLSSEGYLKYCSCSKLLDTLEHSVKSNFVSDCFKLQNDMFMDVLENKLCLK